MLDIPPRLHVPGMTEFDLPGGGVLGLMLESGIRRLLGASFTDPAEARGVVRTELYLVLPAVAAYHRRSLAHGARELSAMQPRGWGHVAGYAQDTDGHVLAFAHPMDHGSGAD